MLTRLVALDEGPDIIVDRAMVVVGRHPQCDARLDSIRISRRHCCMTPDGGELVVRDLGSTNGIRINGQRVEMGRLRPGDELAIAHIRFRLDGGPAGAHQEVTLADRSPERPPENRVAPFRGGMGFPPVEENPLAAAVRELLPAGVAEKCRIQVIVQMPPPEPRGNGHSSNGHGPAHNPGPSPGPVAKGQGTDESHDACPPDSSP